MRFYKFLILLLVFNFGWINANTQNNSSENYKSNSVIKILAIGNSFSQDALESYLFGLVEAENKQVIIGNLYIGGASLDLHWNNAKDDKATYQYRKIDTNGVKTNTPNTAISDALADEDWDFISFQQVSSNSGIYHTYINTLPLLFNYVKQRAINPDVKYILHQTWAYSRDSDHKRFINYNRNQITMYNAIVDAVKRAKRLVPIDIIVPAGTAIQNGRTSTVGDNFCSDGYHLDVNIGRYTAACTWFEAIFGISVIGNSFKPDALSDSEVEIAQYAANFAIENPNKITDLSYLNRDVALHLNELSFDNPYFYYHITPVFY